MAKGRVAARGFDLNVDGVPFVYEAGQRVPDEHVELVTNPKIWEPRESDLEDMRKVLAANATLSDDFFEEYGKEDSEDEVLEDEFSGLTVSQLREFASENEIDLGDASKKDDILVVLRG